MTKNELMARVAAAVTTLATTDGCPETTLYIALCEMDMHEWEALRHVLVNAGYVTIRNHYVTLTPSGAVIAAKINLALRPEAPPT